jgi:hypothetical protein
MAFKFNPFTGTLDQTGSGGGASYIDGEVQNFSALPETLGTPAVDSAYLVREAEGTWLLARKPAGIYIRTADTGVRADDWTHASAFPDVFSDAAFTVYSDGDSTKNLQLSLSGLTTGTTRTLTAPDASGTIALTSDFASPPAIGSTTPNSGAFTTLTASSLVASGNVVSDSNLRMRSNTGQISLGAANDVQLFRGNTASVLELRSGTSPQAFRLYGTFTTATNYQRMTVRSVKQTLSALSGASATTTGTLIPDGAVVVGVTTRVATAITGATGYQVGDGTDADRWGDINAIALNTTSDNRDWTAGTIECFTSGGEVTLTANGSDFTAGAVEICVFYLAGEAD